MMKKTPILLATLVALPAATSWRDPAPRVAVLSIELNNLHKTDPDTSLAGRISRLGIALRARLGGPCGYELVTVDTATEAEAHLAAEYFYQHPDVAAALAAHSGADWVIIPRLNRATAWASDLQAHVVRVKDTTLVSNRIVELKGLELTPELAEHLIDRGAAWMADQISQAIEYARDPAVTTRRCPP
ncbi:MAG TPA: DUF2380 domain-containing protein [Gemmatimonadales bacterium]|jgi:hypothetical protein|nr:DUF2380 domain-containing protein [Gemmatimonadales bacterium]